MTQNHSNAARWLFTFIACSGVIFSLCALPTLFTQPIPRSLPHFLFYLLLYFSQNIIFSFLLGIILAPIFFWVSSDRLKILLALPIVVTTTTFIFMNAKVYAFWRVFVNSSLLEMYFSKGGGSQVFEVHDTLYFWIMGVVIGFIMISAAMLFLSKRFYDFLNIKRWIGCFAAIYVATQCLFIILLLQNNMSFLQYAVKIPYFYDLSLARAVKFFDPAVFAKNTFTTELQNTLFSHQKLFYPQHVLHYHLPAHPLNVLLIVVDSLRYDMINPVNMPHVFRFAEHASQFLDNDSGGDCTRPGIFSLFYSIPATYWSSALQQKKESIVIRAFQDNHYQFGLFASAPLSSPPFDKTVFAHIASLQEKTPGDSPLVRDQNITREMQQFLHHVARSHKPFFGFLFYDAPHAYNAIPLHQPFHPIRFLNYFSVSQTTPSAPHFNLYKNAVFADDQLLSKILHAMKQNHLLKNTVIIITADHGQEFNDNHNNYWEHASGFSQYQVRTPMIIAWPHHVPTAYYHQTTHFDLAPTLLKRVLGVTNPVRDYSVGQDFFKARNTLQDTIVGNYAYYAVLTKNNIIEFHASGLYRTMDVNMNPLHEVTVDTSVKSAILKQTREYFYSE